MDWAEERALKFILDYNNDPLRKDDVTPLAALLREVDAKRVQSDADRDDAYRAKHERDRRIGELMAEVGYLKREKQEQLIEVRRVVLEVKTEGRVYPAGTDVEYVVVESVSGCCDEILSRLEKL